MCSARPRRARFRRAEPCPALTRDQDVEALVADKEQKDDAQVAELVASGVKPVRVVYADGGQNAVFAGYKDESDPDALATGPQEIVLDDRKPAPAAVKIAVADAAKRNAASVAPAPVEAAAAQPTGRADPAGGRDRRGPRPSFRRRSRRVEWRGAERQEVAASGRAGARAAAGRGQRARSAGARRRAAAAASR